MIVNLLKEMRRRRVFTAVASYAVVGWVAIQVLSIIPQALGLSDELLTTVSVVYLALFPVVCFIAWFFDITLEGIKLTPPREGEAPNKISKKYWLGLTLCLSVSIVLGAYGLNYAAQSKSLEEMGVKQNFKSTSIAILPFTDASPAQDQKFLASGIAEEITNQLGSISELSVASSFSASKIANEYTDPQKIAERLQVQTLLTGSIRKNGDQLRVRVELINSSDGKTIWTKTFSRKFLDIFAIEEEISRSVVNLLQDNYLDEGEVTLTSKTASSDAYILYLKGRELLRQRTTESIKQARVLFEQSLGLDPEYTNALVGLSQSIILLANNDEGFGVLDVDVALMLARQTLEKALLRAPNLPEAQAVMGRVFALEHEHEKALPFFDKAISINPSYATAYMWKYLSQRKLQMETSASETLRKAFSLDPAHSTVLYNYARLHYRQNKLEEASQLYKQIISLTPDNPLAYRGLAEIAFSQGDLAESTIQWHKALLSSPENVQHRDSLISNLLTVGAPDLASKFIKDDSWQVNILISQARFDEVHALMDFKLKANPDNKWLLYEAAWYQYLYGEIAKGTEILLESTNLFANEELYYPPLCNPAIEIAYAFQQANNNEKARELISGCQKLLGVAIENEQMNESYLYLSARLNLLTNKPSEAISLLNQAYEQGWREHWTANDPIIQPIRNNPQVVAIINAIENDLNKEKTKIIAYFSQYENL
ncbi:MAG: TolB-like protein/Tfp pilus assembly protein PilF [Glaciecola sp.]|jgi:TolB-like protein/Tfp pilus assembly protein PilF